TLASAAHWSGIDIGYPEDPTTHFEIDVVPPAVTTAGGVFSVTLKALDGSNNVDPAYTGTVPFASTDAKAVLPADVNFTPADMGSNTFQVTLATTGLQTITARDTVDGTIIGTANVSVLPGAIDHFRLAAPAGTTAGSPFSLGVTALDAFNNVI